MNVPFVHAFLLSFFPSCTSSLIWSVRAFMGKHEREIHSLITFSTSSPIIHSLVGMSEKTNKLMSELNGKRRWKRTKGKVKHIKTLSLPFLLSFYLVLASAFISPLMTKWSAGNSWRMNAGAPNKTREYGKERQDCVIPSLRSCHSFTHSFHSFAHSFTHFG